MYFSFHPLSIEKQVELLHSQTAQTDLMVEKIYNQKLGNVCVWIKRYQSHQYSIIYTMLCISLHHQNAPAYETVKHLAKLHSYTKHIFVVVVLTHVNQH